MPFTRLLDELVQDTQGELAIFCDYEGEAIAFAHQARHAVYDVKVSGASLAAIVLSLQKTARESGQSERLEFTCIAEETAWLVETLPGGYYLLLAVPPGSLWVRSRARLKILADRFLGEL